MSKRHWTLTLFLTFLVVFTTACGNTSSPDPSGAPATFTFVYQPGLGAVNFVTLKERGELEKNFPNTKFEWKVLNSGSAVREAILSNQGQLGSLGLPPFLVGWDRGMDYRVLVSTIRTNTWLVARDPRLKTLKDFGPNDKIGVVAPDSQQAILIRKAALDQLGDAHALDKNLVTISSADGEQALLAGQIAANFAGSPFQEREVEAGGHIVLESKDPFGPVGAGLLVVPQSFYDQYPEFTQKLYDVIVENINFVKENHEQAAQYLANDKVSGGGGSVEEIKVLLDSPSLSFEQTPSGLMDYATFMQSIGLIKKVPKSVDEFLLPTVEGNPT